MFLKELESWLERGQNVPFLREICPLKNVPQYLRQYWRHNRNPVNSTDIYILFNKFVMNGPISMEVRFNTFPLSR
jgi:hypothetical protein